MQPEFKGLHIVKMKGSTYCYAWRGGPRLTHAPGQPEFEAEYRQARADYRTTGGKRKLVLSGSKKASLTLDASLMTAMEGARQRAAKRAIPFELTRAYLLDLLEAGGGRCALSGKAFDPLYDPTARHAHNPYGISIDRIEGPIGYVPGNVRLILTALNFAINQWGLDAYLDIAETVLARSRPALTF